MTLRERMTAFNQAYAKWPASHLWPVQEKNRDVAYGVWVIGNDYRNKSRYYGAFPNGLLDRIMALFPDVLEWRNRQRHQVKNGRVVVDGDHPLASATPLHVFSGSLPPSLDYTRVDINPALTPDICASVYDLPAFFGPDPVRKRVLVIADPPYSAEDASRYNTHMIDRRRALAALAQITTAYGHLVWLDTCWPMHRKTEWVTVGRILIQRSTNHRARVLSIFERVA